jgi:hypothetical protein
MKLISTIALSAAVMACSASPETQGTSEVTKSQQSELSTISQFTISYTATGNYYIGYGMNRISDLCVPTGYSGEFNFESVSLDADANNNYFVNAQVNVGGSYTHRYGVSCVPRSSVADTGGQGLAAWHGNTWGEAYNGHTSDSTALPTSYPAGHQLCLMTGIAGITANNRDLSQILYQSNQIYTQTSYHSDLIRSTAGTCDEFASPISLGTFGSVYTANGSVQYIATPYNQLCAVTEVAGDVQINSAPAQYWWSALGPNRGLYVFSSDNGATWPWVQVRCLALY